MLIRYRTVKYQTEIECITVQRETAKTVFFVDKHGTKRREAKNSECQQWHTTWDDAYTYLLERARRRLEVAKLRVINARADLDTVQRLQRPT